MSVVHITAPQGDDAWTDLLVFRGAAVGFGRWCSIGWHLDCSDPTGERFCRCHCHPHPTEGDDGDEVRP